MNAHGPSITWIVQYVNEGDGRLSILGLRCMQLKKIGCSTQANLISLAGEMRK